MSEIARTVFLKQWGWWCEKGEKRQTERTYDEYPKRTFAPIPVRRSCDQIAKSISRLVAAMARPTVLLATVLP
jgi:hypothetical protein